MESFEVVVLGGGSAAESCASEVAAGGRSVAVVESHRVGGECPFVSCMPSKAVLWSAAVRRLAARAHELGAVAGPLDLGDPDKAYAAALSRRDEIAGHLDDTTHAEHLEEAGVTLVRGRGRVAEIGIVAVGDRRLRYADLVIATGSAAMIPPIDGIDELDVSTSDDAWTAHELPRSAIVLGGGPVRVELAQAWARFGSAVTLIEAEDRLLSGEDPAVGDILAERLHGDGITPRFGVEAGVDDLRGAERVVAATGRAPNVADLGLELLGIDAAKEGLETDERCRVTGQRRV